MASPQVRAAPAHPTVQDLEAEERQTPVAAGASHVPCIALAGQDRGAGRRRGPDDTDRHEALADEGAVLGPRGQLLADIAAFVEIDAVQLLEIALEQEGAPRERDRGCHPARRGPDEGGRGPGSPSGKTEPASSASTTSAGPTTRQPRPARRGSTHIAMPSATRAAPASSARPRCAARPPRTATILIGAPVRISTLALRRYISSRRLSCASGPCMGPMALPSLSPVARPCSSRSRRPGCASDQPLSSCRRSSARRRKGEAPGDGAMP